MRTSSPLTAYEVALGSPWGQQFLPVSLGSSSCPCSPECAEGEFCELRLNGVLRSSSATNFVLCSTYCSSGYTHPPTGVCCHRYYKEARSTERRPHVEQSQQPGIKRTDLGVPRREVVQLHTWTQKTSTTTRKSTSTSRRDGVYFGDCKPNNLVGGASIK